MPDSSQTRVEGQEHRDFETRFANGQPPTGDFGTPDYTTLTIPPGAAPGQPQLIIEEWFYSSVKGMPPPEPVMETCRKCEGHVHQVKVLFGPVVGTPAGAIQGTDVQDQQHALEGHHGSHFGERYTNSLCQGRELTRTKLTWPVSGRTIVKWETKTINHIKNGFVWFGPIGNRACPIPDGTDFFLDPPGLEGELAGNDRPQQQRTV